MGNNQQIYAYNVVTPHNQVIYILMISSTLHLICL